MAGPRAVLDELKKTLQGQTFESMEQAQAFVAQFMNQQQAASIDDFRGLSPAQMHRFLYFPFDSPDLATFPSPLDVAPDAPIAFCFEKLAEAIGEDGLKPTAIGNLPRTFCREAWEEFPWKESSESWASLGKISTERDFSEMHVTKLVADAGGLIRKYKGKLILGKECRKVLAEQGMRGIYPRLLRACAWQFNWACKDGYPEMGIIQQSFLFTLYLLSKYGGEWRECTFYEDIFLRAFPNVLSEVPPDTYFTPERTVRLAYALRSLKRFAYFMGLIEVERIHKDNSEKWKVRKLPLLDHVVRFYF